MSTAALTHITRVQDAVRDAHASRTALRIVGGGRWLYGGRPTRASTVITTADLAGVRAYVPGDLVITVGAGTTLAEIAEATAEHGQWLPLDPPGDDRATIGAVIATGHSGALSLGAGRVRDLLLEVEVVDGTGERVRAGAPVVKNVAGFDLVRLAVGAFGTLGVVTEATFRLYARPAVDETFTVPLGDRARVAPALEALGLQALSFAALELLDARSARACGITGAEGWTLLARATGNRRRTDALRSLLAPLGTVQAIDPQVWSALRALDDASAAIVARLSDRPSRLSALVARIEDALRMHEGVRNASSMRATPHSGTVRVTVEGNGTAGHGGGSDEAALLGALGGVGASVIFEQLSSAAWKRVPGAVLDTVSRRVRDAFDPARILNPGILGEEDVG